MPRPRKEKVWTSGTTGPIPPFPFKVWLTKAKTKIMFGFDEEHIRLMMEPAKPIKVKRIKEKPEKIDDREPMGPAGHNDVGRPAEYEPAFKILKEWVDSQGGPPEEVRKKIREHWIDYQKVEKKSKKHKI
jgi:hypothetical protein